MSDSLPHTGASIPDEAAPGLEMRLFGPLEVRVGSLRLRDVQTGYIRSYVLFLVLAAVGLFLLLSWFVTLAVAR